MTSRNPFRPIAIGRLRLRNNLIAAPMAGLSSLPYRILAMEKGCALSISEMVSAEGLMRAHEKTRRHYLSDDRARPFGVQIFGADPKPIADAIRAIECEAIDLIDINMGCPVKRVCSQGAGAALMRDPVRAESIIEAARSATARPLTVKLRAGWSDESINCAEMARMAEGAGADAIAVHPRTRKQEFGGKADWSLIGRIKAAVKIPVIGNGDVKCRDDAVRMLAETGCDAIMIGRAALGNPWIFRTMLEDRADPPSSYERASAVVRHLEMLREFVGDHYAILNMRTILPWYGKGMPGVRAFLRDANCIKDIELLKTAIGSFFSANNTPAQQSQ